MAPRKPKTAPAPIVPTVPTVPTTPTRQPINKQPSAALPALPDALPVNYPDIGALLPKDWFDPASSSVPRKTAEELSEGRQIAAEQANAIELLHLNVDNAISLAQVAVKSTKLGKLAAEYLVGLEEIRAVGVKLRNAQAATDNEELNVQITQQKGQTLNQKLVGEGLKTQIEVQRNGITQLESDYLNQLKPIKQTEWSNKLKAAQDKASQALNGSKTQ